MPIKQKLHKNLKRVSFSIFLALGVLVIIDITRLITWGKQPETNWYRIGFLACLVGISVFSVLFSNTLFKRMSVQANLFEDVLKTMSDGVVVTNLSSQFMIFNKAAREIIGIDPSENESPKIEEAFKVYQPDQITPVPKEARPTMKALKGFETDNIEQFIVSKNRPEGVFLNVSAKPLLDSNNTIIGSIATFQDITEKFKLTEALRKNERLFYTLFEFAPDAIVGVDEKGKINRINSQAEILFEYSRDEVLGKKIEILIPEGYPKPIVRTEVDPEKDSLTQKMAGNSLSLMGRKKDGSEFALAITVGAVHLENKSVTLAVIRDITEQKKSEATIKALNSELQIKLSELEYANSDLKAFSYSVSHDLRAPLRSMIAFSNGILEENESILPDEAKRKLKRVLAASQRMGNLVDALLALAQLSRKELKLVDVDLGPIAKSIISELEGDHSNLKIEAKLLETSVVRGDPDLLYALLKNLLSNAIKFSSKKDVVKIEFGYVPTTENNIYFIRDNGIGFDMNHAKNLFHDFERLHHVNDFEGTGIGLSSTRRIIEKHGGKIWAESKPNEGATFYFQFNKESVS